MNSMTLFDGQAFAHQREQALKRQVQHLASSGVHLTIGAISFVEDTGSQLYTSLKAEAADRVGIKYVVIHHSLADSVTSITKSIQNFNQDPNVTGIIIQKPWRKTWLEQRRADVADRAIAPVQAFNQWWTSLTSSLDEKKDVDGLHPNTIEAIKHNTWKEQGRVLPATCAAVVAILDRAHLKPESKISIVGKSDLLGRPLSYVLKHQGYAVELLGSNDLQRKLQTGRKLLDADVVVSATGHRQLITGDLLSPGVVLIDVGEPHPDIDQESVASKADFLTPVPGGVGPVTVVCLLENAVRLMGI